MICSQIFYFENCLHTLIIMHKNIFHECCGGGGGITSVVLTITK